MRPEISVVSPVFNEEACLPEFLHQVNAAMALLGVSYELILVDDGSRDASWEIICAAQRRDERIRGVRFSRNFGHHVALSAGLDHAAGRWVVVMDSDLQDDPAEIATLYVKVQEGFDVMLARRRGRQHGAIKQWLASGFYRCLNYLSGGGFDPEVGVFRIMSHQVVSEVCRLREASRFFSGLVAWVGFRQGFADVTHGSRHAGETKYPLHRQLRLAFDAILSFSDKPLKLAVYLGMSFSAVGMLYAAVIVVRALLGQISVSGYASLMSAMLVLGGAIMMTVGLVGVYVGRVFRQVKERPLYIVAERGNFCEPQMLAWPGALAGASGHDYTRGTHEG